MKSFFIYDNNNLHFPYKKKAKCILSNSPAASTVTTVYIGLCMKVVTLHSFFHWTEYFFHHWELLTFNGHHDPQLSVQQLKPPLQILLLLPADTVRPQINTRVCVRCVWCVWVSALTAAPGCPVGVSEHSSCSPEWTTPESASPPRHGHFLFQQEIWRAVCTQLDGLLEKIPAPESQMERQPVNMIVFMCLCVMYLFPWGFAVVSPPQQLCCRRVSALSPMLPARSAHTGWCPADTDHQPHASHTHTRTQSPMNTHRDIGRQSQRNEKGERKQENTEEEGQKIKGWAKNQKNHAVNEASLINWRQTQK